MLEHIYSFVDCAGRLVPLAYFENLQHFRIQAMIRYCNVNIMEFHFCDALLINAISDITLNGHKK